MDKLSISVIVPVWNERLNLQRTLPAFEEAVDFYGAAELLLIDNGSNDGSYQWLVNNRGQAKLFHRPDINVGAVRNEGVRQAAGEILCFLDADCLVSREYLLTVVNAFREDNGAIVGASYELPSEPGWIEATWHDLHQRREAGPVNYINGGNLAIKRDVFKRLGGFSEELVSGEDAEFCQRARSSGYTVYEDPRIEAIHLGNPKTLWGFFRKQLWHGLGMLGTVNSGVRDKPFLGTVAHIVMVALSLIYAVVGADTVFQRVAVVTFGFGVVPITALVYRAARSGRPIRWLLGFILYEIYFVARSVALATIVWRGFSTR